MSSDINNSWQNGAAADDIECRAVPIGLLGLYSSFDSGLVTQAGWLLSVVGGCQDSSAIPQRFRIGSASHSAILQVLETMELGHNMSSRTSIAG